MTCTCFALRQSLLVGMAHRVDLLRLPGMNCTAGKVGYSKDRGRDLVWLIVPDTAGGYVTEVSDVVVRMNIRGCADRSSHPYPGWIRSRVELLLCS